jgi:hypothetical protein
MANNTISTDTYTTGAVAARTTLLPYPRLFFNKVGKLPSEEEAKLLWNFRKNRPSTNAVETAVPDGEAMQIEMKAMRDRLRKFIAEEVWLGMKEAAQSQKVVRPSDRGAIVLEKDLVQVLESLTDPEENKNDHVVFMICHEFHRSRSWLANKVDKWLLQEGMVLLDDSNRTGTTKKASTTCRGGFGAIARDAKSQAVAKKMTTLAKQCSWHLATTDKSSSAKMDKCLSYVKKFPCRVRFLRAHLAILFAEQCH